MLVELRPENPVVFEVIDKVIQGVCKQLQSVSLIESRPAMARHRLIPSFT